MRTAVIVDAVRTPIGKGKASGALHDVHAVDLLAHSLRAIVERTGIDPGVVDDVIAGVVGQVGEQSLNIARRALLAAGLVDRVQLTAFPVISGRHGTDPVFGGAEDFDLDLLETRTFDGRSVELVYRPTLRTWPDVG